MDWSGAQADAIVYADQEGIDQVLERGRRRMSGFAQHEAIGQSLDLIIPTNLRQRHWQGFRRTMRTGESRYGTGDTLAGAGDAQGWRAHFR